MATQVQLRRGTATENNSFTGAQGELTFDTTNKRVRIHDGATAGGFELKTENSSGDTLFADNEKAIFGAGSDLQIYHDGANSYIQDVGTGALGLFGSTFVGLYETGSGDKMVIANGGSDVELYYDNALKLATTSTGVDVTGTITSDGLTVDGALDVNHNRITQSANSPRIDIIEADVTDKNTRIWQTVGQLRIYSISDDTTTYSERIRLDHATGDISFFEDTGTTAKFFWDASVERLGIGVTDPDAGIEVQKSSTGINSVHFANTSSTGYGAKFVGGGNTSTRYIADFRDYSGTSKVRIDGDGNLFVGTAELNLFSETSGGETGWAFRPDGRLYNSRDGGTNAIFNRLTSDGDILQFRKNGATVGSIATKSGEMYLGSANTGIRFYDAGDAITPFDVTGATGRDNAIDIGASSSRFKDLYLSGGIVGNSNSITISTDNGTTDHVTVDTSGNLLVGTTSLGNADAGVEARANGTLTTTADSQTALFVKRIGSGSNDDGELARFQNAEGTVGSIGSQGGSLVIGTDDTGFKTHQGVDAIVPYNPSSNAARDNAIDLGYSTNRFKDIYATNGTIQTSDEREKQDIAELSDAEQRVAVAAKGLLRKFRWRDAVEAKGDEARTHFGIIAQDLQAAFAAEGLDAGDYAMFISSTWTDEDTGEERTRMGVRYSELLAFIIAVI